jgi:hypothetical protein
MVEVTVMISESSEFSLQVDGVKAFVLQLRLGRRNIWKRVIFQLYLAKGLVCEVISRD